MALTVEQFTKAALLNFAWSHKGPEQLAGMTAICCVIRNRVIAGWHNADWLAVIEDAHQKTGKPLRFPDTRDPLFTKLLWKVESIFDGTIDDLSAGAKYWCDLTCPDAEFKEKILDNPIEHVRTANIGNMYFFK